MSFPANDVHNVGLAIEAHIPGDISRKPMTNQFSNVGLATTSKLLGLLFVF